MKPASKPMRRRHAIMETRLTSGPGVRPANRRSSRKVKQGASSDRLCRDSPNRLLRQRPGARRCWQRAKAARKPVTAGAMSHQTGSDVRASKKYIVT